MIFSNDEMSMFKKTLHAALLLAPLAAAHAQDASSSVSIYGILDAAATLQKAGSGAPTTKSLDSGVGYGSRLGFKGSEDLGDGLRANFLLEMGLGIDTGTLQQGGSAFGRQAYVGLSAPHWSLTAGRQYSPLWLSMITSEVFGFTYWGNTQATQMQTVSPASVAGDGGFGALSRVNNSIIASGFHGPFTGRLMVAAGEPGRLVNPSVTYAAGPVTATASLARFKQFAKDIPAGAVAAEQNAWDVGATYDFGVAKLFAGYYHYDPSEANIVVKPTTTLATHSLWLGTQVPIGVGRLFAQVISSRFDRTAGVAEGKATTLGLAYEYALSKRTFLYTSYGQVSNNATSSLPLFGGTTSVAPKVAGDDPRALSVGMRHSF